MHPDSAKYLWDVRYAAALVERFIAGKGFDEYASDLLVKSAVERQLEIIGEALNALSRKDPSAAANIAELPRIVAFRNLLIMATQTSTIDWSGASSRRKYQRFKRQSNDC